MISNLFFFRLKIVINFSLDLTSFCEFIFSSIVYFSVAQSPKIYIFFLYKNIFAFDLFLGSVWELRNVFWVFLISWFFFLSKLSIPWGLSAKATILLWRNIQTTPQCTWYVSVSRGFLLFGWSLITSHLLDCMHAYTYDLYVHMHASLSLNWKFFFVLPLNCLLFSVRFVEADFGN